MRKEKGFFKGFIVPAFVLFVLYTIINNCSFNISYNMSSEGKKSWIDRTFEYGKKAAEIVKVIL